MFFSRRQFSPKTRTDNELKMILSHYLRERRREEKRREEERRSTNVQVEVMVEVKVFGMSVCRWGLVGVIGYLELQLKRLQC